MFNRSTSRLGWMRIEELVCQISIWWKIMETNLNNWRSTLFDHQIIGFYVIGFWWFWQVSRESTPRPPSSLSRQKSPGWVWMQPPRSHFNVSLRSPGVSKPSVFQVRPAFSKFTTLLTLLMLHIFVATWILVGPPLQHIPGVGMPVVALNP